MPRIFVIIVLVCCLLTSCSSERGRILEQADTIMESRPDSALSLLKGIDRSKLSNTELPYYALLITQSSIRNHSPLDSDSLISIAYRKYADNILGDKGIRSNYYMGETYMRRAQSGEALKHYLSAYEDSKRLSNNLWIARSAERIAHIFFKAYSFAEAEKYLKEASKAYESAGHHTSKCWSEARLRRLKEHNWNPTERLQSQDSILRSMYQKAKLDLILDAGYGMNSLTAYWKIHDLGNMAEILKELLPDKANLEGKIFFSNILRLDNEITESDSILMKADRYVKSNEDRITILYSRYMNAKKRKDLSRIEALADSIFHLQEMAANSILNETLNGIHSDFYVENSIRQEKMNRVISVISLCAITMISLLGFFIWRCQKLRNQVQKAELEANIEAMVSMKAYSDKIRSEKILLRKQIDDIRKTHENDIEKKVLILESLFKDKWSSLNKLCEEYYETGESNKMKGTLYRKIETEIRNIGTPEGLKAIEEETNKYLDGIVNKLKKGFPSLKDKDIAFCSLIFAGFSTKAICFILNIQSGNFYVKKGRLIKKISESNNEYTDEFISRMK